MQGCHYNSCGIRPCLFLYRDWREGITWHKTLQHSWVMVKRSLSGWTGDQNKVSLKAVPSLKNNKQDVEGCAHAKAWSLFSAPGRVYRTTNITVKVKFQKKQIYSLRMNIVDVKFSAVAPADSTMGNSCQWKAHCKRLWEQQKEICWLWARQCCLHSAHGSKHRPTSWVPFSASLSSAQNQVSQQKGLFLRIFSS